MRVEDVRIGVALCGAELAGTAHIGVLCALEQMGIPIHHIAGVSSGSLIAAMYAHGYRWRDFQRMVRRFPGLRLADYGFPLVSSVTNVIRHPWKKRDLPVPSGVVRGARLYRYVARLLAGRRPTMTYSVLATDLYSTDVVVFTNDKAAIRRKEAEQSRDLAKEVVGSCAIPGMMTPVKLGEWLLIDGGVRDLVPVNVLRRAGCNRIIAVDVHRLPDTWYPVTAIDVITRAMAALLDEAKDGTDLTGDDVFVIRPDGLLPVSWWSARKPMRVNIDVARAYAQGMKREMIGFLLN